MEYVPQLDRRTFLRTATLASAGALGLMAAGCTSEAPLRQVEAYLPTTLPEDAYETMGTVLGSNNLQRIGRMTLAFADINPNIPDIQPPRLSPGLRRIVLAGGQGNDLSLAVGGGNVAHSLWETAASDPKTFAVSVNHVREKTEQTLQRRVHVTLDCESSLSSGQFTDIARSVRDRVPSGRELITAVTPVDSSTDPASASLKGIVQQVQVMTYDQYGSWSDVAGPATSWPWVSSGVSRWVSIMGEGKRVEAGFPTYGYEFIGANKMGDPFQNVRSVLYADIPRGTVINDNTKLLTSETVIDGNTTSCISPHMIEAIDTGLRQAHPNLGGVFFWSMQGLTPQHLDAVGA